MRNLLFDFLQALTVLAFCSLLGLYAWTFATSF